MSKLSPSLKALINAPFARPGQVPAPRHIAAVYSRIAREARERRYGERPWVTLSAAATFTLNSPASLLILHQIASSSSPSTTSSSSSPPPPHLTPFSTAALIREIGLKCISFNGIPRTINCLGAFRAGIASEPWAARLAARPATRRVTAENCAAVARRGERLWTSVYAPFDRKLVDRLAESHPDLPVHILGCHYGPLLADPEAPPPEEKGEEMGGWEEDDDALARVGRGLTSVVAVACLRAQTGVGPQVLSHVFGLRKALEQGVLSELEVEEGVGRLAEDEGCEWLLRSVDAIAKAIGGSFARWDGEGEGDGEGERERRAKL